MSTADAIERRCVAENWTAGDLAAAVYQCALLSYRSAADAEQTYGEGYVKSGPEDYAHNCPWNDWTPPSQSQALFTQATANKKPEAIDLRVRVRVGSSSAPESATAIAFASVETNSRGNSCLVVRRGADVLSSMAIATLHADAVSPKLVVLTATPKKGATPAAPLCLTFEDKKRLLKFCNMVLAGATAPKNTH
jgi:hypothetical protein